MTSPAASPRLGTIGLAILDADVANDGEKVEVAVAGRHRARHGRGAVAARPEQGASARLIAPGGRGGPAPAPMLGACAVTMQLFGVVPNFSEGRRTDVIDAIVEALHVPGARVVYAEADPDHNRLDTTVLGGADAVRASALAGAAVAVARDRHAASTRVGIRAWAPPT